MKFCTHIQAQRINPNNLGNPLTFYLAPPAGQIFSYPVIEIGTEFGTDIHANLRVNCNNLVIP